MITSFRDVIALWDGPDQMAAEIGAGRWAVHKWRSRNSIPSEWWLPILRTPVAKQHGLNGDLLAVLAGRERVA